MNIKSRLKSIIEINNMKLKEFSDITGIPYSSLQNYLRGEREPNVEALSKICSQMNINLNWLILGTGNMQISHDSNLSLLDKLELCSEQEKKAIEIIISSLANR